MSTIDYPAAYPRLRVRETTREGRVTGLDISIAPQPDDDARAQLVALLARMPDLERLVLGASLPELPEVDVCWALDAIRTLLPPDSVFLTGARVISIEGLSCRRLGTANRIARFHGSFAGVRILDLRDDLVELHASVFPELETLILRPRHGTWGVPWARKAIAAVDAFPALREVRCPENHGDELLAALLESPLLERLRRIDLTDNITNAGAQQLQLHAERLGSLEELWIGSRDRRWQTERMNPGREYPLGTLEVDHAWRSRLRSKLGKRVRLEPRPGHPDL